jgi:DNA-binding NtrC family response regulator
MTTTSAARILVVDDDRVFRLSTAELLRQDGYEVVAVEDGEAAVAAMREAAFDLILLDLRMPGPGGMQVIEVLRRWGEAIPVLMITGYGSIDAAVSALHTGADDFLTKPVDPDVLSSRVADLLERRPAARAVKEAALRGIVGRSGAMQEVFQLVRTVSPTETTVLLTGETGTGKEIVARAIHDLSPRARKPFVPVDCASMAEGVLESELFGHTKGAFTGAVRDKRGFFEAADKGTIFLDEIGDTSPAVQQRLLRVLQEREISPVGSVAVRRVDVRVIAATNRDLATRIAEGSFREDLYYRLNVFHIRLPPLRERRSDIPLLVEAALERVRASHAEFVQLSSSPLAMRMLRSYDWPGNVRELFAVVESSAVRAAGARIEGQHLPPAVRRSPDRDGELQEERYRAPDDERAAIQAALDEAGGVRARAAELLGMGRTTLWRKLKQYGLDDRSGE